MKLVIMRGLAGLLLWVATCLHCIGLETPPIDPAAAGPMPDAYCTVKFDTYKPPSGSGGVAIGSPEKWLLWPKQLGEKPPADLRVQARWRRMDFDMGSSPEQLMQDWPGTFKIRQIRGDDLRKYNEKDPIPLGKTIQIDIKDTGLTIQAAENHERDGLTLLEGYEKCVSVDSKLSFFEDLVKSQKMTSQALVWTMLEIQPSKESPANVAEDRQFAILQQVLENPKTPLYVALNAFSAAGRLLPNSRKAGTIGMAVKLLKYILAQEGQLRLASLNLFFGELHLVSQEEAASCKSDLKRFQDQLAALTLRLAECRPDDVTLVSQQVKDCQIMVIQLLEPAKKEEPELKQP